MKIEQMQCPGCGATIKDEGFQVCPYCGQVLYADDESQKITYKKIDEARLKEAETKEKIRMKELELEEKDRDYKRKKDDRADKFKIFMKRVIIIAAVILVIALAFLIEYLVMKSKADNEAYLAYQKAVQDNAAQFELLQVNQEVSVDEATLSKLIEPASELVAYKYYYTTAGVFEDSKKFFGSDIKVPFTTDKSIYLVDGIISTGIDINGVKFDVDDENKTITISMPNPVILSHEIDTSSFRYYDVKNSVFNSSNLNDYAQLETVLKQQQENKLLENVEYWDKTKTNVKTTIASLVNAAGKVDDYRINYEWY